MGVMENPIKSCSLAQPRSQQARLGARNGSVCQCRCWARSQKLSAPARKWELLKEQRAGRVAACSLHPQDTPKPTTAPQPIASALLPLSNPQV